MIAALKCPALAVFALCAVAMLVVAFMSSSTNKSSARTAVREDAGDQRGALQNSVEVGI
jgi:hypothetical protein